MKGSTAHTKYSFRDYCRIKRFNLLLSSTEYTFKKSVYILNEVIENLNNYDGIIFYSFLQLPELDTARLNLYKSILKKRVAFCS